MEGYLREAEEEDMELLFQWVNEPGVRKGSFSTAEITYEEHREWYKKLLASENSRQYIYICAGEAIGQARIAIMDDAAVVGYSICAEKRGMGHGKKLLHLLEIQVKRDFPNVKKLVAKVKQGNIASQRAFLGAGYMEAYEVFELHVV